MGCVLVDSNVLLDVLTEDPQWAAWSTEQISRLAETEILVINPIIYAEVSVGALTPPDTHASIRPLARGIHAC